MDLRVDLLLRKIPDEEPSLGSIAAAISPLERCIGRQNPRGSDIHGEVLGMPTAHFRGELLERGNHNRELPV